MVQDINESLIKYRDYIITYWCKPIPDRRFDYDYQHKDFDIDDDRCGSAISIEACKIEIDEQLAEGNYISA